MGVLATDNRQLIYIYSEDSRLGKETLSYVQGIDKALRIINVNKEPISDTVWIEIASLLNIDLGELFSSNKSSLTSSQGKDNYKVADWLKMIEHNPALLQRPIAIDGSRAKQISMSLDIYAFFGAAGGNFDKSTEAIKNADHFNSVKKNALNQDIF